MVPVTVTLAVVGHAATLTVGPNGDHDQIADAVRAAASGDRIEVDAGAYTEAQITLNRDLEIVGIGGSGATSWTGPNNEPVLFVQAGTTVTLEGFSLRARGNAVAVRAEEATLTLRDLVVDGNRAPESADGSALFAVRSSVVIEASRFTDNRAADGRGGHLFVSGGTLSVADTRFEDGLADRGGAIMLDDVTADFADCEFRGNEALEGGGLVAFDGDLTLTRTVFEQNRGDGTTGFPARRVGDGGAVLLDGDAVGELVECELTGNTAVTTGGGVRAVGRSRATFTDSVFTDNAAGYGGGAYLGGTAILGATGATFSGNQAVDGSGGAIRVRSEGTGVQLGLETCALTGNTATELGGAIAVASASGTGPEVSVANTSFSGNEAVDGGAVHLTNASAVYVDSSVFCANRAVGDGGGAAFAGNDGVHQWTSVVLAENRAGAQGGGLYVGAGDPVDVVNGSLLGNRAPAGGGVWLAGGAARLENTLVAFTPEGDGLAGTGAGSSIEYSDFWDNVGADFPAPLGGPGMLAADPDLDRWTRNGDCTDDHFWPVAGSPLIDAGNPALQDRDGSRSDIGAYGGPTASWPELVDLDGDGAYATVDCDEGDPDVHPGADEVCDGVDQDCDGATDEDPVDAVPWWSDGDGDGFGVDGDPDGVDCVPPEDAATADGDCDDSDDERFPGAVEACDGEDDDCDGVADEDGASDRWPDEDGDGFGDRDVDPVEVCGGDGLVENGDDCDDGDPAVNPDADDEVGDDVDANCDGLDGVGDPGDGKLVVGSQCAGCDAGGTGAGFWAAALLFSVSRRRRHGA